MKIKRIDSDRTEKEVERIEIEIDGIKYTLTDRFGELKVHAHSDAIFMIPCCANEVVIEGANEICINKGNKQ